MVFNYYLIRLSTSPEGGSGWASAVKCLRSIALHLTYPPINRAVGHILAHFSLPIILATHFPPYSVSQPIYLSPMQPHPLRAIYFCHTESHRCLLRYRIVCVVVFRSSFDSVFTTFSFLPQCRVLSQCGRFIYLVVCFPFLSRNRAHAFLMFTRYHHLLPVYSLFAMYTCDCDVLAHTVPRHDLIFRCIGVARHVYIVIPILPAVSSDVHMRAYPF